MRKGRRKTAFRWLGDWTILWVFGGFALTYFAFVPLETHPLHWIFSIVGGVAGYGIGLFFDTGFPSVGRFVPRSSERMTLKQDRENKQKRKGR